MCVNRIHYFIIVICFNEYHKHHYIPVSVIIVFKNVVSYMPLCSTTLDNCMVNNADCQSFVILLYNFLDKICVC